MIFAAGDVGSDTDVCGCKVRKMGGVSRRVHAIRSRVQGPALVLDAGDLFFRSWTLSPRYEPQAKETARFHADTMRALGAQAMAVGERDLALGLSELRGLGKRSGMKLLSVNLVHTSSKALAFERFAVVEVQGVKVGLVGASPELKPEAQAAQVYRRAKLDVLPAGPGLQKAAKEARAAGAEVVIALLHLGERRAVEVLGALPEGLVNLAYVGHDRQAGKLRWLGPKKPAMQLAGNRGKWVIATALHLSPGATELVDLGAIQTQQEIIKKLDQRIATYQSLDAGVSDPTLAKRLAEDHQKILVRLRRRREAMEKELQAVKTKGKHRVRSELVPLDEKLPEDPQIASAYRAYQDRLHLVNTGALPPQRAELKYTGNGGCKSCHPKAYKHWKRTKHAKAWDTMVRTRQTANLDCVPCHSTGFDRPGGPDRLQTLKRFVNVGCESCHGAGSAHAKNPKISMDYPKNVPEKVCAECHRVQADQKPFVYEKRLPKVLGKGHGRPSGPR